MLLTCITDSQIELPPRLLRVRAGQRSEPCRVHCRQNSDQSERYELRGDHIEV